MTDYWKRSNAIDPMSCENNFYTMKGLCYTSDGKDYLELVEKEMGLPEDVYKRQAYQLYQSGEIDSASLTESNLNTIYNDESNPYHDYLTEVPADKYSYQTRFNYNKKNEDGTPDTNWNLAAANEAFRLSWYYGLDLTEYFKRSNRCV